MTKNNGKKFGTISTALAGQKIGALTVLYPTARRKNRHAEWVCLCDCGNTFSTRSDLLVAHKTTQCPQCLKKFRHMPHQRRIEYAALFREAGIREVEAY